MLAISQNPDRVSNILRSSVVMIRLSGIPWWAVLVPTGGSTVASGVDGGHAIAPSSWCGVTLRLGGELEEHLLQAGAVGRPQLHDRYAGGEGDLPDQLGVGLREQPVLADGRGADTRVEEGTGHDLTLGRPHDGPRGPQQVALGALGHDAAVADHHEVVGDHLDLVEQVGGEQHGAAAVGVVAKQATHPADAGRVEAVGRLVEDQHLRLADQRGRDAEPLPHAQRVVAHPPGRLLRRQADQVQHLLDAPVVAAP